MEKKGVNLFQAKEAPSHFHGGEEKVGRKIQGDDKKYTSVQ